MSMVNPEFLKNFVFQPKSSDTYLWTLGLMVSVWWFWHHLRGHTMFPRFLTIALIWVFFSVGRGKREEEKNEKEEREGGREGGRHDARGHCT